MQPPDYFGAMGGVANAIDPAKAIAEGIMAQLAPQHAQAQIDLARAQSTRQQAEVVRMEQEATRQAALQARMSALGENPSSSELVRLMVEFPEASEAFKRAFDAQDSDRRRVDFREAAQAHDAARRGSYDLAAQQLRRRVEADRAAGAEDPYDAAILADLESGDPQRQADATEALRRLAAIMAGEERFAAVYGVDDPKLRTVGPTDVVLDERRGTVVGQSPIPRVIPGENGSFFEQLPAPGVPVLGGGSAPASGAPSGQATPPASPATPVNLPPGIRPRSPLANGIVGIEGDQETSARRSRTRNAQVGGVENSYHLSGRASDRVPPAGMSMAAYANLLQRLNPSMEVINEGDHVHIEPRGQAQASAAVQIRSVQEYNRLPSGAQYRDPQGNVRRKP